MTPKADFIRRWKRLQILWAVFVAISFAAFLVYPDALLFLWAAFFPLFLFLSLRLRCWNCGERMLKDGAAHLEWRGSGNLKWKLVRHKLCGAELS